MIGTTGITELRVHCIVGIYPHERAKPQTVVIDIELDYEFEPAANTDSLSDAIDYDRVISHVTELFQTQRFKLLETMAERTTRMLFDRLPAIRTVRLLIRKPAAVPNAAASFVRIERNR